MIDATIHEALVAAHEVIRDEWIVALQSYCDTDAGGCPDLSTMDEEARPYIARLGRVMEQCRVAIEAQAVPMVGSPALADVAAERLRQVEKLGWTHDHDDQHDRDRALPRAAACYAIADDAKGSSGPFWITQLLTPRQVWPLRWEWKPKDRRTNLVRAAALLIAEIERLDRATQTNEAEQAR